LSLVSLPFSRPEWTLLTRLPGRVVTAAAATEADRPRRTVADGLAGLDHIAAGRVFDSDLVRAVVAAIYAEAEPDSPAEPAAGRAGALADGIAGVLADCRHATLVLSYVDPADSATYRQWLQSIAARVCGVTAPSGSGERRFLAELGSALSLA
jgi:hypothetical protein